MLVINRFHVPAERQQRFRVDAEQAMAVLRTREGFEAIDLVQNLDEPELFALVSRWANVGSYRRALGGFESKVSVVPLLSLAIDEASAYDHPDEVGLNLPRVTER